MSNTEDQDKVLDFVQNPENIKKAVESGMDKRQKVLDTSTEGNLELRKQVYQVLDLLKRGLNRETSQDLDKATDEILDLIKAQQTALLKGITESGYDDMHKTYDYKRIVEALFEKQDELDQIKESL